MERNFLYLCYGDAKRYSERKVFYAKDLSKKLLRKNWSFPTTFWRNAA